MFSAEEGSSDGHWRFISISPSGRACMPILSSCFRLRRNPKYARSPAASEMAAKIMSSDVGEEFHEEATFQAGCRLIVVITAT